MSSSTTSPSQSRRKPAPPRTPTADLPKLPDPPQEEEEERLMADPDDDDDDNNDEANVASVINPSTIPPKRSSLFSSSLLGSSLLEDNQTPTPSQLARAIWDTPDNYPPY